MNEDDKPLQHVEPYGIEPQQPTPEQDEPNQWRDVSQYSLTAEVATQLFNESGVPRSLRTMIRYCKEGALDCIKVDTERNPKYLITRDSVDIRIGELQQIAKYEHSALHPDVTRHDVPQHDMTSRDAPDNESKKIVELESRVGELQRENQELIYKNRDLEITNRVKDAVIEKGEGALEKARGQLMKFNRVVGQLTQILRFKAPEEDTAHIVAYLDAPTDASDPKTENFVDDRNRSLG